MRSGLAFLHPLIVIAVGIHAARTSLVYPQMVGASAGLAPGVATGNWPLQGPRTENAPPVDGMEGSAEERFSTSEQAVLTLWSLSG